MESVAGGGAGSWSDGAAWNLPQGMEQNRGCYCGTPGGEGLPAEVRLECQQLKLVMEPGSHRSSGRVLLAVEVADGVRLL